LATQTTGSRQKLLLATNFTPDRGVETFSQKKHVMEDDSISVSSGEIYVRMAHLLQMSAIYGILF
jgi:hypothetical protein